MPSSSMALASILVTLHGVAGRFSPLRGGAGAARSRIDPEPACGLPEDLAVGGHFPVGQRAARGTILLLPDWRRPLPGGRDVAAGTCGQNSAGVALAGRGGDGADVFPDGGAGPGVVAAARPHPAAGSGVGRMLTPSPPGSPGIAGSRRGKFRNL